MSAGIALNAIFISLADGFNQEIVGLLFGSISAVNLSDLITITIISIVVLLFILLLYKELFILSLMRNIVRLLIFQNGFSFYL